MSLPHTQICQPFLGKYTPYTTIPDYVWGMQRDCSLQFSPMTRRRSGPPVEEIVHPDGKSALKAAKQAAKEKSGRYYGRHLGMDGKRAFNVYENGKVLVRHIAGK